MQVSCRTRGAPGGQVCSASSLPGNVGSPAGSVGSRVVSGAREGAVRRGLGDERAWRSVMVWRNAALTPGAVSPPGSTWTPGSTRALSGSVRRVALTGHASDMGAVHPTCASSDDGVSFSGVGRRARRARRAAVSHWGAGPLSASIYATTSSRNGARSSSSRTSSRCASWGESQRTGWSRSHVR